MSAKLFIIINRTNLFHIEINYLTLQKTLCLIPLLIIISLYYVVKLATLRFTFIISYFLAEIVVIVAHNKPTFVLGGFYIQQIPYLHH